MEKITIEVRQVTSWVDVVNAARFTQHLAPLDHEPSDAFKRQILLAEHSPIRQLFYEIKLYNVPSFVAMHLVRYNDGVNKFVATSRPDITGEKVTRHEQRKDDPCDMLIWANAQAIMHISNQRLCKKAERETRVIWGLILLKIKEIDSILYDKCVPQCIHRGFCPERESCGYFTSMGAVSQTYYYLKK